MPPWRWSVVALWWRPVSRPCFNTLEFKCFVLPPFARDDTLRSFGWRSSGCRGLSSFTIGRKCEWCVSNVNSITRDSRADCLCMDSIEDLLHTQHNDSGDNWTYSNTSPHCVTSRSYFIKLVRGVEPLQLWPETPDGIEIEGGGAWCLY